MNLGKAYAINGNVYTCTKKLGYLLFESIRKSDKIQWVGGMPPEIRIENNIIQNMEVKKYMTESEIEAKYQEAKNTPSDINMHMEVLREYAEKCNHITEMGVRGVVSTWSFLASKAEKVVAIDILDVSVPDVEKLTFICADDLAIDIEETDMLFLDTRHCYEQCIQELNKHASNVRRWIFLHDVAIGTFGVNGDDGGRGLLPAIEEFLANNEEWVKCYHVEYNNGLMGLERKYEGLQSLLIKAATE